ncbi:MAG: hypothetical protein ACK5Y8_11135 [Betaproteobacteria bacterium]|jgi:hypothetical protein|nr:hypothetical protein [Rubrivivax sp.]
MSVFTVYCHGTGYDRIKGHQTDELVAWFHNHTAGVEATLVDSQVVNGNYLINEGPGHDSDAVALPQQINPITGNARDDSLKNSLKRAVFGSSFADHVYGDTSGKKIQASLRGKITGQGWTANTQRTVNIIQHLKFDLGRDIDVVNLVGWSRGAVTCMRIANLMMDVFGTEITCNIFAVDPVAGQDEGIFRGDTRVLQQNVKNYVGILAMHERRSTFKPQDWSRVNAPYTDCIFLPMPGVHSTPVIPGTPPQVAYITRNLACGLLRHWGSPITSVPFGHLCSSRDMSLSYAQLVLALSAHREYQTQVLDGLINGGTLNLRRRDFAKHSRMDHYTRGGKESYWINEHHRACFADAFPDVYAAIFESTGKGETALTANSKYASFAKLLNDKPHMAQSLQAKGLLAQDKGTWWLGIGAGRYTQHMRAQWNSQWPLHA